MYVVCCRSYPIGRCLDASALISLSFAVFETNDPSHLVAQCVNSVLVYVQYADRISYPVAVYKSSSINTCTEWGNYSNYMSCDWSTQNPILSLEFPDERKPIMPSNSSQYAMYELFESGSACGDGSHGMLFGGTLVNYCYLSNDTFTMLEYDGKCRACWHLHTLSVYVYCKLMLFSWSSL